MERRCWAQSQGRRDRAKARTSIQPSCIQAAPVERWDSSARPQRLADLRLKSETAHSNAPFGETQTRAEDPRMLDPVQAEQVERSEEKGGHGVPSTAAVLPCPPGSNGSKVNRSTRESR